ncbi:dual specificity protein phosphatase family protein [uncultured Shewanella sp.]|uniref:protein-tyrosine phosphatase family protein n=1 Tax=uncultured Shewanella sp. TaxID=173975 RepID=UPI00261CF6AC|nr:dual specificity protein phosphatase family protein [uncultured Shewanella sp.]
MTSFNISSTSNPSLQVEIDVETLNKKGYSKWDQAFDKIADLFDGAKRFEAKSLFVEMMKNTSDETTFKQQFDELKELAAPASKDKFTRDNDGLGNVTYKIDGYQLQTFENINNDINDTFSDIIDSCLLNIDLDSGWGSDSELSLPDILPLTENETTKVEDRFNLHTLPEGTLMSTKRPSGDLESYATMLQSHGANVLLSIDDTQPKDIKAILAQKNISHVNEKAFHIEDFFDKGELPKNKLMDIVTQINELESKGQKVAIHCGAGDGRSGTVKSAYLLEKMLMEQIDKNTLTNETATIETHYDGNTTTVNKAVVDCILKVRSDGHEAAVERTEDVLALQDMYTSLTSSHKFNVSQHVLA